MQVLYRRDRNGVNRASIGGRSIMGGEAVIKGGSSTRVDLINAINEAFNRLNIGATARQLGTLADTGDFLDICEALGLLRPLHLGNFARYRQQLTIPMVNQALLTAAFRQSLTAKPAPIPLQILIASGTRDILAMTSTATEITVVVTRDDAGAPPAPRKRAAARKR
jgi:hypothetical protein